MPPFWGKVSKWAGEGSGHLGDGASGVSSSRSSGGMESGPGQPIQHSSLTEPTALEHLLCVPALAHWEQDSPEPCPKELAPSGAAAP